MLALKGLERCYANKRMIQEARYIIELIEPNDRDQAHLISTNSFIAAQGGDSETARSGLEKLLEISKIRYVSPYDMAIIYSGLNDEDNAFVYLEKAFAERSTLLVFLKVVLYFDNSRRHSSFDDLLKRIGF